MPLRCEPECFFVNPAPLIRASGPHRKSMLHLAALIFNLRPSYGLAFAVVSGLVDSYTGAMRVFLQHGGACRVKLGGFLGEAFSLCTLIRFSVFDSMPLLHTGVLSALSRAFCVLQLPEDLQKIDRLVRGLAHVWWRKHKALADGFGDNHLAMGPQMAAAPSPLQILATDKQSHSRSRPMAVTVAVSVEAGELPELTGLDLRQYLAGSDALCQLMLSTVLLHWYVHSNGSGPGRPLPCDAWIALNRGIEVGGMDVPEHVQRRVYAAVCKGFRQELALAAPSVEARHRVAPSGNSVPCMPAVPVVAAGRERGFALVAALESSSPGALRAAEAAVPEAGTPSRPLSALSVCATAEGWVQLLGGALPCPEGSARGTCEHTASAGLMQGLAATATAGGGSGAVSLKGAAQGEVEGAVWASLCSIFLLFATSPGPDVSGAPYALTDARHIRVADVVGETRVITLQGLPGKGAVEKQEAPITFVVLLSDGRWQEVTLPKLELKVATTEELQAWVAQLVQWPSNTHLSV